MADAPPPAQPPGSPEPARPPEPPGGGAIRPLAVPSAWLTPRTPGAYPTGGAAPMGGPDPAVRDDRRLARVGIPAVALGGVTAAALVAVLIVMLVVGAGTATVIAAVVLAAATAALGTTAVHAGILGRKERPALARWESRHAWIGPLGTSRARALVGSACDAAERIAASAAWWSPDLDDHRLTLDLAAELEQIDGQAFTLASRAYAEGAAAPTVPTSPATPAGPAAPAADPEWAALEGHVAALVDYADRIVRYSAPALPPAAGPLPRDEFPDAGASAAGAARDEFATAHLRQLSIDLGSRPQP